MSNLKKDIEGVLGDYGIGVAECVLCNHDVYNHYWNGAGSQENSGWDSCKVKDCKCLGKDIEKEPNTVYECPLVTRFVPDKHATTQIINLIESVLPKEDEHTWRAYGQLDGTVVCDHCNVADDVNNLLLSQVAGIKSKLNIGEQE